MKTLLISLMLLFPACDHNKSLHLNELRCDPDSGMKMSILSKFEDHKKNFVVIKILENMDTQLLGRFVIVEERLILVSTGECRND